MNGVQLFLALVRSWRWILATAILAAGAGYVISLFTKPVYRSEVVLASVQSEVGNGMGSLVGQFGGLAAMAGVQLPQGGDVNTAIETLKSRDLATALIQSHELMPILFPEKWNAESGKWTGRVPTINDAFRLFDKRIRSVRQDSKTGIIRLTIEWHDPVLAATWANELVKNTNRLMRERETGEADLAIAALTSEVDKASRIEVRTALYSLIEAQLKSKALAAGREQFVFRIIDPALPADADRPIWPNKLVFVFLGLLIGGALSVAAIAFAELRRLVRRAASSGAQH